MLSSLVIYLGIGDAVVLVLMGLVTALYYLLGMDPDILWDRLWPATWALVGTTFAAGVIIVVANWVSGWIA